MDIRQHHDHLVFGPMRSVRRFTNDKPSAPGQGHAKVAAFAGRAGARAIIVMLCRKTKPLAKILGPNSSTCPCGTACSIARRKSSPSIPKSLAAISTPPPCSATTRRSGASSPRTRQTPPPKAVRAMGRADAPLLLEVSAARAGPNRGLSQGRHGSARCGRQPQHRLLEENHQPKPEWECAPYGAAGRASSRTDQAAAIAARIPMMAKLPTIRRRRSTTAPSTSWSKAGSSPRHHRPDARPQVQLA